VSEQRSITIWSAPGVQGAEPMLWGAGSRVIDLLDHIDAGDPVAEVAGDFLVEPEALQLLLDLRSVLQLHPAAVPAPSAPKGERSA
jgi:uncharacterized protein (DUF433 family)